MAIDATTAITDSTGSSTTSASRTTLASNFDTFLGLLTTQLKNQNPLDPLDTNQFTQQLVQFAGVEQQLQTNDTLTALLSAQQTAQATTALGLVGRTVTASGDTTLLDEGKASWTLNADKIAKATVEIRSANGQVVATKEIDLTQGEQDFSWDGKYATGGAAPEGLYSIKVTARDTDGNLVDVKSEVTGKVDGVDLTTGTAVLSIGDLLVPLTALKQVKA